MSRISLAIIAAALWLAAPIAAQAAGLGRLTVLSPLGQPLNAEIEIVSLRPGEEDGLSARLASPEAFRQAGIEPNAALSGMRFTLERRNGRSFIRVTTPQPVNEPFLDLLVELQWNAGRLVREYTVLLDPPEYKGPQAIAAAPPQTPAAPLAAPHAAPVAEPLAPVEQSKPAPEPEPKPAASEPEPAAAAAADATYEVKRGDTLGAIARQHLPPGITLNQMLIAMYRANPDAFIRENVNLVRAGRILSIPSGDSLGTVDFEEANRLVRAHHAEFNEYRARLAAAPVEADAASGARAVAGQREAKPEAPAPEASQDQLRLSKADPGKPGAAGGRAAQDDDSAARERALAEAQSRVADLEKNVADLQKLLELKNQQLAELERKAGAKPAEAPRPEPVTPEAAAPAPIPQAAPPQVKKVQPAKPKAAPPPAPPAPSLIDGLRDDPMVLGGLGAIVLLLLGYAIVSRRRKKAGQAGFQESAFKAGGDAPDAQPQSQASVSRPVAGMGGEEVDPLAEADVYMAYGRDAQAEEILKEALHKDARRIPVHAKLLEIYANRKDGRSFEETALKLKNLTGGAGPEWDNAAALGRSIDPGNGLYGGGATRSVPAAAAAAAAPALDFDLGGGTANIRVPDISLDDKKEEPSASSVDFDLGADSPPEGDRQTSDFTPEGTLIMDKSDPEKTVGGLDFDLDMGGEDKAQAPVTAAPAAEPSGGLDFDLNLDMDGGDKSAQPGTPAAAVPSMDLSDISLDLGSGEPSAAGASSDPKWQEVATKLDLAKAYEEMGDKDGARELLGEVMKDGDAAQKGQAEQLLAKLA
ncbi:MAG TPA: FimV/HubP family polar landmark protein [Burkholderiales bacterium]|nr:FimV/HubP family polar landmark protein [Burkholderiales bacterium]